MSRVRMKERSAGSNPPIDHHDVFVGTDGLLKKIDEAGTITSYEEPASAAASAVAAHVASADPHTQYTTAVEAAAAAPVQSVAGKTGTVTLVKGDVGLGNVDNTSDAAKPVSTAQQTALDLKADKATTIAAGEGLTGGGDLSANRTLALAISSLSSQDPFIADLVPFYSVLSAGHRRTTLKRLRAIINRAVDLVYSESNDFITETTTAITSVVSGTGASVQVGTYGQDLTEKAYGVLQSDTGTTLTGRAHAGSANVTGLWAGQARLRFGARLALESLSVAGVEQFTTYVGFVDNTGAGDQNDGAYFRYTDSVNGGRWEAVCAKGGVRAAIDTGIVGTVSYQVFEVEIHEDGLSVDFYIDGVLVATQTLGTVIPNGPSETFGWGWKIEKSVGTTQRNLSVDWYYQEQERSAAR